MKLKLLPLLLASCTAIIPALHAQVYIDDEFSYADGQLGTPWTFASLTNGTTVNVGNAQTYHSYTPDGKQVQFIRPSGGGAASAFLATGSNPDSVAWVTAPDSMARLTLDFSYSAIANTQAFRLLLRSDNITMFGLRVIGNSDGSARLQYMTTNAESSFIDLPGASSLSANSWYQLTLDLTVLSTTSTGFDIGIDRLGDGGGSVYSGQGLTLTSSANFAGNGVFAIGYSAGNPSFALADVNLAAIPEPSQILLIGGVALVVLLIRSARSRRTKESVI